jgi:hypothetical protein
MGSIWLLWQSSLLSFAGPLIVAAQIACVIHVFKTGRPYWWMWIIFCFPMIGLAAYLYLEVRPSLGKAGFRNLLWNLKSSRERIGILDAELAESTTVRNRLALADELHAAGQFDRECEVLADGLRGAFKDDATLLMRLAEAHLEAGRTAEADKILATVVPEKSPDSQLQFATLKARVASLRGDQAQAASEFQELVGRKKSEGPRYYYAEHLLRSGQRDEGRAILTDILHQYRRGTVVWRYQERKWFYAAKRLLKSPLARARLAANVLGGS